MPHQNFRGPPFDTRLCLGLEGCSRYRIFHLWVSDFFFLHSLQLFQNVAITCIHALLTIKYLPQTLISAPCHDSWLIMLGRCTHPWMCRNRVLRKLASQYFLVWKYHRFIFSYKRCCSQFMPWNTCLFSCCVGFT